MPRGAKTDAGLAVGPACSSVDLLPHGGSGSEGPDLLVAFNHLVNQHRAERSGMDELRPESGRGSASGGPLDGKPFSVTVYEV